MMEAGIYLSDQELERRNPLIYMDKDIIERILQTWSWDSKVLQANRLSGGLNTTNYRILLAGQDKPVLLRIYPDKGEGLGREYAVYQWLHKLIPMPEIYYVKTKSDFCRYPFAIMEFLDGVTLDQIILKQNGLPPGLALQVGETLALIHKKEYPKEGFLDETLGVTDGLPPVLQWYEYFLQRRCRDRLGEKAAGEIRSFLQNHTALLKHMTVRFVLSHGDFRPENMIIKDGQLAGIIDWEFAMSAPEYFDLGQFVRYGEMMGSEGVTQFIKGYNSMAEHPVEDDWVKLAKLMDLTNLLSMMDSLENKPVLFRELKNLVEKTLIILNSSVTIDKLKLYP